MIYNILHVAHGPVANGLIPVTSAKLAFTRAARDIGPKLGSAAISLALTFAAAPLKLIGN